MTGFRSIAFSALLLLAVFATSCNDRWLRTKSDTSLPVDDRDQPFDSEHDGIVVNVSEDGRMMVDSQDYDDAKLFDRLQKIAKLNPNAAVLIRGDEGTKYEHIVRVLNTCKRAGVWNVSYKTVRPATTAP